MVIEILNFSFTVIDLIIIIIIAISGLLALYRGLITESLSIAGWVGAAIITLTTFPLLQPITRKIIPITLAADVITGIVIFLISLVVISLITHSIANIIRGKTKSIYDRGLGLVFGILRGIILLSLTYLLSTQIIPAEDHPESLKISKTLPMIIKTNEILIKLVPD